jgi:serralysin
MNKKVMLVIAALLLLITESCKDETPFTVCGDLLGTKCPNSGKGEFCTFGYKWGSDNPFSPSGLNTRGPGLPGMEVTYHFKNAGTKFSTHSQEGLISKSFDERFPCETDTIRKALMRWEQVANISFVEVQADEPADISFLIANIEQSALGYPPFNESSCLPVAGFVILQYGLFDCRDTYGIALHEIGHALGLGHVSTNNVMNPNYLHLFELQPGDIKGIQSIYGAK